MTDDSAKGLVLQGVALEDLLQRWGSPLHVVDAAALRENARRFLKPRGKDSGCEVFYSYKTNPVPGVLRVLHEEGVGAEVISHHELWLARRLGVAPERIIYNGPGKSRESLREAIGLGIQVININHAEEVARVAEVARELGRRQRVGLRISTGAGWTAQFGTPTHDGAALRAFAAAHATGVLDVVGVHAHLGGMIHDQGTLLWAVNGVLDFVEQLESELGLQLQILNFGGSLATPTVHHDTPLDRRLNQTFHRELPEPAADASLSIEDYIDTLMRTVRERYQRRGR
ncbi:MAG TPA: alanine racemase, partial [Steroidobacteraceae bacterium]|nr:alanine racemase [Steroidobacteraceae bacterium]